MPAYTFTANAGTDEITTSSPHGLATGDGPASVRNVGGALPTAAPALVALTDYWVIVTGASTLKLATSSANAMANVFIDITGAGTGTHYFEIGIPYRRPRTYGVGSQLKSADLNDNFDAWKALYALLTGQSQSVWDGIELAGDLYHGDRELNLNATSGGGNANFTVNAAGYVISTASGTWYMVVPLRTGDRIKSISFLAYGDGAADLTTEVNSFAGTMTGTGIGTDTTNDIAASWTTITINVTDTTYATRSSVVIAFSASAANLRIGNVCATYDRPR